MSFSLVWAFMKSSSVYISLAWNKVRIGQWLSVHGEINEMMAEEGEKESVHWD